MGAFKTHLTATVLLLVAMTGACIHPQPRRETTMTSSALSVKQRRLVAIATFATNGDLPKLATALSEGLEARWTINEIKEVLVQLYAYAGFPRSLNAIITFMDVLDQRRSRGISDEIGREPSPMPADKTSIQVGTDVLIRLHALPTGRHLTFAPAIDAFLKGHLFGDIISRDNLDIQSREIATISALATLDRVDPQLASHFNVGMNVGLTESQLRSLVAVVGEKLGTQHGEHAAKVLDEALTKRAAPKPIAVPTEATYVPPKVRVEKHAARSIEAAPAEHFTGVARVERLFQNPAPAQASGASVTFEPGARTAWHSHALGQTLIVTSGTGWVQQWGEPKQTIETGDVVMIPPNVKHWHGATATSSMTHIAIQEPLDGKSVDWMEPVTAEQYNAAK
jgi:4-carboxymuconolactone decarboxylase